MITEDEANNFETFRECFSITVIERLAPAAVKVSKKRGGKGRKNSTNVVSMDNGHEETLSDAAELSDFIEYLAEEIFQNLQDEVRELSYAVVQDDPTLSERYATPLDSSILEAVVRTFPSTVCDSLCSYGLIEEASDLERFLEPTLSTYVSTATAAPPEYTPAITASRPSGCEICGREHIPLTYHHLIPRQTHAKAIKRGWHKEWELNKVAWLCRACHSYVHKIASNEELARELYDVELLLDRDDVQKWASWIGRVRWKSR